MTGRSCFECGARITRHSKTGRCRACNNKLMGRNPEIRAKAAATFKIRMAEDPRIKANLSAAISKAHRDKMARDPAYAEQCRENGRKLQATGLGHKALGPKGSPGRKAMGQKLSDQRLGQWCPREYRALYQTLRRTKGYGRHKARKMVEERIAADKAAMTPFERQMEAIRNGARLIARFIPRKADYAFTLGGVSEFA